MGDRGEDLRRAQAAREHLEPQNFAYAQSGLEEAQTEINSILADLGELVTRIAALEGSTAYSAVQNLFLHTNEAESLVAALAEDSEGDSATAIGEALDYAQQSSGIVTAERDHAQEGKGQVRDIVAAGKALEEPLNSLLSLFHVIGQGLEDAQGAAVEADNKLDEYKTLRQRAG